MNSSAAELSASWRRRDVLAAFSAMGMPTCAARAALPKYIDRKIGINSYDLFMDGFRPGGQLGTRKLEALGRLGIPFVRFAASLQWAGDWAVYENSPKQYWSAMDDLFSAAEHSGICLVPSVLWNAVSVPFHLGEPVQMWANPSSRTRAFAARYTAEMVHRYDSSSAVLMWEFCNELNNWVDLPNVLKFWPKHDPTLPHRIPQESDRLSSRDLHDATAAFASIVRKHGKKPVCMGSNAPRTNAWHLARGSWDKDDRAQFISQFRAITPATCEVLCMHLYPDNFGGLDSIFLNATELISAFCDAALIDNSISFIGEFGVASLPDKVKEHELFDNLLDAIVSSQVDYAALWDYDHRLKDDWNITTTNDRAYQLQAVVDANKILK